MLPLFIFPNDRQLALIRDLAARAGERASVVREQPAASDDVVRAIVPADLAGGAFRDRRWHCASELAIYLVASLDPAVRGSLAFDDVFLSMLTKMEAAAVLRARGIPVIDKRLLGDSEPRFPCIAKPNFGFASILVRRIASRDELREYVARFDAAARESLIELYRGQYRLATGGHEIVVEDDFSAAAFLSVPFLVENGRCTRAFPVAGVVREQSAKSDFFWTGFEAPAPLDLAVGRELHYLLDRVAAAFAPGIRGVFHAELIATPEGRLYVIELSPRVSGGSLPLLIREAHGVDIDEIALAFAAGLPDAGNQRETRRCVLLRRALDATPPAGTVLAAAEKTIGAMRLVDEIVALDEVRA